MPYKRHTITARLLKALESKVGGDKSREVVIKAEDLCWLVRLAELGPLVLDVNIEPGEDGPVMSAALPPSELWGEDVPLWMRSPRPLRENLLVEVTDILKRIRAVDGK